MKRILAIAFILFVVTFSGMAQQDIISLPSPERTGGIPLMDALNARQSTRKFTGKDLEPQVLSNLLWAAYGFNRTDKRTVPSSQNRQETDVLVMFKDGVYLYDAKNNRLILKQKGDFRKGLGTQDYIYDVAVNLVFVANLDKASNREAAFTDAGFISQNVYLFCASEGLGTVARGGFNKQLLSSDLNLTEKQEITLVQAVGTIQ